MVGSYIEVVLMKELHASDDLAEVVAEAQNRELRMSELRTDPVVTSAVWESKEKSTQQKPILYLTQEGRPKALILQGPNDKRYRMFEYRWIA